MAVLTFDEIAPGRDGAEQFKEKKGVTRYTRTFLVRTDTNTDEASVIFAHASCPNVGDVYPYDADAFCTDVRPVQHKAKTVWRVTARYSTEYELSDNPLNDAAEIEWNTEPRQKAFWKDRDGNAILNSAGDYYDPPVEGDDSRWVATVSKNLAAVPAWTLTYKDATNSDQFTLDGLTIAIGVAKLSRIRISKWQERNDIDFRVVTFSIAIDENGWAAELLDQGFRELDGCTGAGSGSGSGSGSGECDEGRVHITDKNGDPVVSPVPLDGNGCALDCPTPETAVFRTHHIHKVMAFSSLPLT
jgi:hypothetical protein